MLWAAGILLLALTAFLLWHAARRIWHLLPIVALAAVLFPAVVTYLTGDVSRYFPPSTFADGLEGKDRIALASAAATIMIALSLGAVLWTELSAVWRSWRKG